MARAKRTERSEARRRYRAATGSAAEDGALEAPAIPPAAVPRGDRDRRGSQASPAGPAPVRAGMLGTLRAAAGPVDIAGDLRALPQLLRSRAGWVPALAILVTTVAMLIPALAANQLVALAGTMVLAAPSSPPMIIAFLAGMLAPRGAWLMGGFAGLLAAVGYLVSYIPGTDSLMTPLGFSVTLTAGDKLSLGGIAVFSSLVTATIFGIAVGAFAGFYRRFLNMSAPQRQAQGARKR